MLIIVNNAAVNIRVHISFQIGVFIFFEKNTQKWNFCLVWLFWAFQVVLVVKNRLPVQEM